MCITSLRCVMHYEQCAIHGGGDAALSGNLSGVGNSRAGEEKPGKPAGYNMVNQYFLDRRQCR